MQSLGSNKALEFLNAGSIDLGSTAGAAALLGRINGNPIQAVYVYCKPEWTALVTRPDTGIGKVEDLKGKRIAVTKGTDPYIFLLRALDGAGLAPADVQLVLLQHDQGRLALERGDVDAWAGLDPMMADDRDRGAATRCSTATPTPTPTACSTCARRSGAVPGPRAPACSRSTRRAGTGRCREPGRADGDPGQGREAADRGRGEADRASAPTSPTRGSRSRATPSWRPARRSRRSGVIKPEVDVEATVTDALLDPRFAAQLAAAQ